MNPLGFSERLVGNSLAAKYGAVAALPEKLALSLLQAPPAFRPTYPPHHQKQEGATGDGGSATAGEAASIPTTENATMLFFITLPKATTATFSLYVSASDNSRLWPLSHN
jgi:hypothetical protein